MACSCVQEFLAAAAAADDDNNDEDDDYALFICAAADLPFMSFADIIEQFYCCFCLEH